MDEIDTLLSLLWDLIKSLAGSSIELLKEMFSAMGTTLKFLFSGMKGVKK